MINGKIPFVFSSGIHTMNRTVNLIEALLSREFLSNTFNRASWNIIENLLA